MTMTRRIGVVLVGLSILLGFGVTTSSAVAVSGYGTDPGNSYTGTDTFTPACPNALAGTPGSDPAAKVLNSTLNTAASFNAGGTIHYIYNDNPNTDSEKFELQDCIVSYPAGYFSAADVDPVTGVVTNVAKKDLDKNGTELDSATLTGVLTSTGQINFNWTSPGNLAPGTWVCNFARDISLGHGGDGNRKVTPTCFEVTGPLTPEAPTQTSTEACGVVDTYTIPTSPHVTYQIGGITKAAGTYDLPAGTSVAIDAVADQGYTLADTTTSWDFTGGTVEACQGRTVTPAIPTQSTSTTCGVVDTYTVPGTSGVVYKVGGATKAAGTYDLPAGTSVTVTAEPASGVVFPQGAVTSWGPFTGSAVETCGGGGSVQVIPTTTTTTPPTTTTTEPVLAFTEPQGEVLGEVLAAPADPAPMLPFTGGDNGALIIVAAGLLGAGGVLIAASRRKPQRID